MIFLMHFYDHQMYSYHHKIEMYQDTINRVDDYTIVP
jgi:hypothetical protein